MYRYYGVFKSFPDCHLHADNFYSYKKSFNWMEKPMPKIVECNVCNPIERSFLFCCIDNMQ